MASATTHPMNVHPRKRLMTATDPRLGTLRTAAMIVGRKYREAISKKPTSPNPASATATIYRDLRPGSPSSQEHLSLDDDGCRAARLRCAVAGLRLRSRRRGAAPRGAGPPRRQPPMPRARLHRGRAGAARAAQPRAQADHRSLRSRASRLPVAARHRWFAGSTSLRARAVRAPGRS